MLDATKHTYTSSYNYTTEDGDTWLFLHDVAATTVIEAPTTTYCVWKYGDDVNHIYYIHYQGNATSEQWMKAAIALVNGTREDNEFTYHTPCQYVNTDTDE